MSEHGGGRDCEHRPQDFPATPSPEQPEHEEARRLAEDEAHRLALQVKDASALLADAAEDTIGSVHADGHRADIIAALEELLALLSKAEQHVEAAEQTIEDQHGQMVELMERVEKAEQERDEAWKASDFEMRRAESAEQERDIATKAADAHMLRAEAAERELERLRELLQQWHEATDSAPFALAPITSLRVKTTKLLEGKA